MIKPPELTIKNILIIGLVAGIGGLAFFVGIARYTTTSPSFCLSCHGKGDTPNIGFESEIHPSFAKVACVECHSEPQTGLFRPWAEGYQGGFSADPEMVSENCVRCHESVLESGVTEFEFNVMQVKIPHLKHLEMGILCVDCHSNITHDKNREKTNRPKMETCMKCHDHNATSCYTCHNEETLPLPKGEVAFEESCIHCHSTFKESTIDVYGMMFSHETHLGRGLECTACHSNAETHGQVIEIQECNQCHGARRFHDNEDWGTMHSKPALKSGKTCAKCHDSNFCVGCHQLDMPHPDDWIGTHFEKAYEDKSLCEGCHERDEEEICQACHS